MTSNPVFFVCETFSLDAFLFSLLKLFKVIFWLLFEITETVRVLHHVRLGEQGEVFLSKSKGIKVSELRILWWRVFTDPLFLKILGKSILCFKDIWYSLDCNHSSGLS